MNEVLDLTEAHEALVELGKIPVLGTDAVKAKPKRKRKKAVKPRAAKVKVDPILEASKASLTTPVVLQSAQPVEEAPAPSHREQGVGADHFEEARVRRHERQFRADVVAPLAPPLRSSWRERFVFIGRGLRNMGGLVEAEGEPEPVRLSTTVTAFLILAAGGAGAGFYLAWF